MVSEIREKQSIMQKRMEVADTLKFDRIKLYQQM